MTSAAMQDAIDKFLSTPIKAQTKEEAEKRLQACGILNKDGTVADRFKTIIVPQTQR